MPSGKAKLEHWSAEARLVAVIETAMLSGQCYGKKAISSIE